MSKQIVFSGIQPSGQLTIGHYFGAIRNWVSLQDHYDCLFSIVDLHALSVPQDPIQLRDRCFELAALYIACGIDPQKATIFIQSRVSAHTQLAWILGCQTFVGELNRMTQFKEKSLQHAEHINAGLYTYPILMAADILLYQTNLVPVGNDQKQHLELTRDIAQRFNHHYGELFTIPEYFAPPVGARLMSLQEPEKKMSKSDKNTGNFIALLDSPDVIVHKVKRAVTDSDACIRFDSAQKPGVSNLLTILASITDKTMEQLEHDYQTKNYGVLKKDVADAIIALVEPIQAKYQELHTDHQLLLNMLEKSAEKANTRAQKTLQHVQNCVGLPA